MACLEGTDEHILVENVLDSFWGVDGDGNLIILKLKKIDYMKQHAFLREI